MKSTRFNWVKITSEAVLIIVSVFVAISLESMWKEHSDAAEARSALTLLLRELQADNEFLQEVLAEQEMTGEIHSDLLYWFADPGSLPVVSVHEAFETLADTGLTMWARQAAWRTMVESGQLTLLDDSELVAHLGDHFEHLQRRLKYIEERYDVEKFYVENRVLPKIWDRDRRQLLTEDPTQIDVFRNHIYTLADWNRWYLEYLVNVYGKDLSALINEVEQYLFKHGNSIEYQDKHSNTTVEPSTG